MEKKYTQGPWKVNPNPQFYNGNKAYEINYGTDGECVAEIVHNPEDAALIAASPDLLEALERILEIGNLTEAKFIARAAIAKATTII